MYSMTVTAVKTAFVRSSEGLVYTSDYTGHQHFNTQWEGVSFADVSAQIGRIENFAVQQSQILAWV